MKPLVKNVFLVKWFNFIFWRSWVRTLFWKNIFVFLNLLFILQFTFLKGISLAKQKAMELNEKLDYLPSDFKEKEAEQQIQYFEEELEINDFPQMLRFRVCSRVRKFFIDFLKIFGFLVKWDKPLF